MIHATAIGVFRAKHWEIFTFFIMMAFLHGIFGSFGPVINAILYIVYISLHIGWLIVLGTGLQRISPKASVAYKVFLATGIILIVVIVTIRLSALFVPGPVRILDHAWSSFLMMAYVLLSLITLSVFVVRKLRVIEIGNDIDINDYFGDIFRLLFWPIGIWTLQPRVNKLVERLRIIEREHPRL